MSAEYPFTEADCAGELDRPALHAELGTGAFTVAYRGIRRKSPGYVAMF
jgi:hypothetical protein